MWKSVYRSIAYQALQDVLTWSVSSLLLTKFIPGCAVVIVAMRIFGTAPKRRFSSKFLEAQTTGTPKMSLKVKMR
jgi:hypothetical protein